jgi:dipeptidyl-peptidase-4
VSARLSKLTLAQVAAYPRPGTAIPAAVGFTPDSKRVTYLASAEGSLVLSLWTFDPATGERRILAGPEGTSSEREFTREEQLRRERMRMRAVGVTSYSYAKDATPPVLMVPNPAALRVLRDGSWLELEGTAGALDSQLSRDGAHVLFARDGELWTVPTSGAGMPVQLTSGAEDGLSNGAAEFIAAEELGRSVGAWWSHDGRRIAYIQADSRHVADYPIVHQGSPSPAVEHHRYPFAGDRNATLRLGVIPRAGGDTLWLDTAAERDAYIARVAWRPSGALTVEVLSRDQHDLEVLEFDVDGRKSVLRSEHSEPWYNLGDETRYLDSGEVLFSSERTGFRHLYLRSADGREQAVTSGEWLVTRLVELDERGRRAWFEATRESPLERHVYRVSLDGGEIEQLTRGPGFHGAVVSPDHRSWVEFYSSCETAPVVRLRRFDGSGDSVLFDNGGMSAASLGLQVPELTEIPAADGTPMHAALYTPPDSAAGQRRPLIVSVYGGPHAQMVGNQWGLTVDLRAQYLAQNGYVVLKLDNRGSAGRGLAFEAALANRFGTVEVEDQVAAVEALAARGIVDRDRVGIYGWSYGGYMTAMAMLRRPDLFKVGVAGAPVADWDGYDTGYTERYMGTPEANPDGYRDGSLLTHASQLAGKLLLVHGGVDENVHFRHTARFIVALTNEQKPYDLLLFPEERHMPRDAAGLEYMERRLVDYFNEHL